MCLERTCSPSPPSHLWIDGRVASAREAGVSPLAHALHYGTGVFEGVRCYSGDRRPAVFRLPEHLSRMQQGAEALALPFDAASFTSAVVAVLRANHLADAYVRPLAFFEAGGLGLDVAPLRARHLVAAMPWTSHLDPQRTGRAIHLRTSSRRRTPASSLPPLKLCGGYVASVLAKLEAAREGYDEALFVDEHGFVCEATGENVFVVKRGRVVAVQHPDALAGITRATLISLAGADERPVTRDELLDADEIFLTGTSAEVVAVGRFDARDLVPGAVTRELAALYDAVVHGRSEVERSWRLEV